MHERSLKNQLAHLAILTFLLLFGPHANSDQLIWESSFENGYPGGEWLDLGKGAFSSNGAMPEGMVSAWTIVDRQSGEPVFAGDYAYKGWIDGVALASHRAYPVIHANISTPLVNIFHVYLDIDYSKLSKTDWVHLGTWGNYDPKNNNGLWALHTMSV